MITNSKKIDKLIKHLGKNGYQYKITKHVKIYSPGGKMIVTIAKSPKTETRTYKNIISDLRKSGVNESLLQEL